jgi:hypothetical protein
MKSTIQATRANYRIHVIDSFPTVYPLSVAGYFWKPKYIRLCFQKHQSQIEDGQFSCQNNGEYIEKLLANCVLRFVAKIEFN